MEQQAKWLLAWMNEDQAVLALLGRERTPREDISGQLETWQESRKALMGRPVYRQSLPALSKLQGKLKKRATAFQQRPDVVAALQGLDWTIEMVDLRSLISFQWVVAEEDAVKRTQQLVPEDPDSLFSFCLPESANAFKVSGRIDQDRKGITLSSQDPNLRAGPPVMVDLDVSPAPGQPSRKQRFLGFPVNFGSPFIQVAEYNGRWLLKDGYHRCYGLLRRSIYRAPCIVIKARDFAETGASRPDFIPYETLFGDRPPLVSDFLDDSVAAMVIRKAQLKLLRVTAAEFVVET